MNWLHILMRPRLWFVRARRKVQIMLNPSQRAQFTLEDGSVFECALADSAGRILTQAGSLERCEREFVRQLLEPGDIFFDVGANLGLFTITAARRVGDIGHVYAFEPSQREAAFLQRNLELNRLTNVTVITQAVSDHAGAAQLAIAADGGNNSLMKNAHPQQQISSWQTVELTTLDSFVTARGISRVDLIKIDVEGGEAGVLHGGAGLLNGNQPPVILAEFCDVTAAGFGSSGRRLYETFVFYGYQLFGFVSADNCNLAPVEAKSSYDYENLVARKSSKPTATNDAPDIKTAVKPAGLQDMSRSNK